MINFSPSNDKIYNRCIHQIAFCAKCSRAQAELALIRVRVVLASCVCMLDILALSLEGFEPVLRKKPFVDQLFVDILKAIRKSDMVSASTALAPKSDHIRLATPQTEAEKLVPQIVQAAAILLASGNCQTYAEVRVLCCQARVICLGLVFFGSHIQWFLLGAGG